ncbi:hypothetical protein RND81_07G098100 [Saponaria officinalis]|uniref:Coenzyme Q-binding protein COQ10 START domain-containing protein n=1 Tax=Saponaria officinalis TaxID=3572 RepID=A0AAW1JQX5_SAPOF
MKLTTSHTSISPIYSPISAITKFTTITNSIKFISFSFTPQFSSNSCKNHCYCTSTGEINPSSSNNNTVFDPEIDRIDGVVINIAKIGKRCRRIDSSVVIDAGLQIVWGILTDYEKLADFIPGLAVSRLIDKRDNYARLFQIGQQNLPLGFKFNAKAVLDCYEKELEILTFGQRRDIEFKMVEGDFDIFEGKWSIEQYDAKEYDDKQVANLLEGKEHRTILSYVVEVKPKPWLPVGLIEDRLCRDIKTNLCCVREEAHLRLSSSYS